MDFRNIRFTILAVMIFVAASAGCETMTLGNINIEFNGVGSPGLVKQALSLSRGQSVDGANLETAMNDILKSGRYLDVAYRLTAGRNDLTDLVVSVTVDSGYRPDKGERVRIDRIEFFGNTKTRKFAVIGEMAFQEGDEVNREEIEASVQRIFNREYFYDMDWGLFDEGDQTILEIRVRERWTTFPVVYFRSNNLYTMMMLGAYDSNLAGLGFSLRMNYNGYFYYDSPTLHTFTVDYIHPRIGGTPLSLRLTGGSDAAFSYMADSQTGLRYDAFSLTSYYTDVRISYEWESRLNVSALMEYSYDIHSDKIPVDSGYTGYNFSESIPSVGGAVLLDRVDLYDQRRDGYLVGMEMRVKFPLSGYEEPYFETLLEGQYHRVFADDWLNLSTRFLLQYSSANLAPYQINRSDFLRGGLGGDYQSALVTGLNAELGLSPLRNNWLFLELTGVFDIAWGGDSFPEAFGVSPQYRIGPGLRVSWPPIAEMYIVADLLWTETGDTAFYFAMTRFF